jgi:hypothetical protein
MKKMIALAVVALFAATMIGCGPAATSSKPAAAPTGTTPTK